MSTAPVEAPSDVDRASDDDDLDHIVCCCTDDLGLCGTDLSDATWGRRDESRSCVVCDDLDRLDICTRCGAVYLA